MSTPACPAASQVGSVAATAGAGTQPLNLSGKAYLAGPYKGAPLSLSSTRVPRRTTTSATWWSGARGRSGHRPGHREVGPTAADHRRHDAAAVPPRSGRWTAPGSPSTRPIVSPARSTPPPTGTKGGDTAPPATHYQVANCTDLRFAPKLELRLSGSTKTPRQPHSAALCSTPGPATRISNGRSSRCRRIWHPRQQPYQDRLHTSPVRGRKLPVRVGSGSGDVVTPRPPPVGPVTCGRRSHSLPDLVVALKGQFDIELVGQVGRRGGRPTVFDAIPGRAGFAVRTEPLREARGLLQNTESLCKASQKAAVQMTEQTVGNSGQYQAAVQFPERKAKEESAQPGTRGEAASRCASRRERRGPRNSRLNRPSPYSAAPPPPPKSKGRAPSARVERPAGPSIAPLALLINDELLRNTSRRRSPGSAGIRWPNSPWLRASPSQWRRRQNTGKRGTEHHHRPPPTGRSN